MLMGGEIPTSTQTVIYPSPLVPVKVGPGTNGSISPGSALWFGLVALIGPKSSSLVLVGGSNQDKLLVPVSDTNPDYRVTL